MPLARTRPARPPSTITRPRRVFTLVTARIVAWPALVAVSSVLGRWSVVVTARRRTVPVRSWRRIRDDRRHGNRAADRTGQAPVQGRTRRHDNRKVHIRPGLGSLPGRSRQARNQGRGRNQVAGRNPLARTARAEPALRARARGQTRRQADSRCRPGGNQGRAAARSRPVTSAGPVPIRVAVAGRPETTVAWRRSVRLPGRVPAPRRRITRVILAPRRRPVSVARRTVAVRRRTRRIGRPWRPLFWATPAP